MMIARRPLILFTVGLLGFAACTTGGNQQQALAPTSTLAPIVSMTPRFTATPVASRTPLPTATFTPSTTPVPPTPTTTPTPTQVPPMLGIIASRQSVNVREGPGTSFDILLALDPGTGFEVLEQSDDGAWFNILMDDGQQGWVSSSLVYMEPTTTPIPTLTATVDRTAIALGTAFPTAILGGAPVSPTPPPAALSATAAPGDDAEATGEADDSVIDEDSFNMTATALIDSITGGATAAADAPSAGNDPVGGPTGGPVGGPTATLDASQSTATARQRPDVLAYCDKPGFIVRPPSNLEAGQMIDVYWSWFARTEALLQDHMDNAVYEVSVDGQRLTTWRQYAAPVTFQSGNYYQYWYVPFGPLTAGEHEISYRVTWREAISDGYDDYGPGTAIVEETGSCAFTVQ